MQIEKEIVLIFFPYYPNFVFLFLQHFFNFFMMTKICEKKKEF